jgi:hypothetical protein
MFHSNRPKSGQVMTCLLKDTYLLRIYRHCSFNRKGVQVALSLYLSHFFLSILKLIRNSKWTHMHTVAGKVTSSRDQKGGGGEEEEEGGHRRRTNPRTGVWKIKRFRSFGTGWSQRRGEKVGGRRAAGGWLISIAHATVVSHRPKRMERGGTHKITFFLSSNQRRKGWIKIIFSECLNI